MSFKTILVPTDFSENAQVAFEVACDLALRLGAKLQVLHVQDESALRIAIKEGLLQGCSTDEECQAAVERLTEERFSRMFAAKDCSNVAVGHAARRGDSDYVITAYASEINAGMIVIGRRGASLMKGIISAVVGSVAESVIAKSPCPVLVVRRDHKLTDGTASEQVL
ncbi:MAG TPA: universal stress protein [Blastocatellia bacterium]|nr:universal stress protein [Blastocatellia bacterium]